jgi:hypothetical protein
VTTIDRAIAMERSRARRIITDPTAPQSLVETAWAALCGWGRHPDARRPQPNLGAAVPSPDWPMSAAVLESGCKPWGDNDAR